MTQQQVFSLYLVNPEQKVKTPNGIKRIYSVDLGTEKIEVTKSHLHGESYSISDCKLLLKRISDMSYEDWVELAGYVFDLKLVNETAITMRDLLMNGDGAMLSFKSIVKINEWLITHGYCLDEQWIKNGWVEIEKVKETCPDCGGDGKETCNNPDHAFINAVGGESYRLGCPVCGHDEKHKVPNGGNCETCNGNGWVACQK